MDFRHLIVTCLFSKLRLPFDNQKVKENYAILYNKRHLFYRAITPKEPFFLPSFLYCHFDTLIRKFAIK